MMKKNIQSRKNRRASQPLLALIFAFMLMASLFSPPVPARAAAVVPCGMCITIVPMEVTQWTQTVATVFASVNAFVLAEFAFQRIWWTTTFWYGYWLPAFQGLTGQLSAVSMQQAQIFGSFLDAKHQLETQQLLQKLSARAHKDYHPSVGMCELGTAAKSLAASERRGEYNMRVLSQRAQERNIGAINTVAAPGRETELPSRLEQFKKKYCDTKDNNGGLGNLCRDNVQVEDADPNRRNKDIDYVRTVDMPWTLKVDFTDGSFGADHEHGDADPQHKEEEDVMALGANLYANDVFTRPTWKDDDHREDKGDNDMKKAYLDLRSVLAKRSVAMNSYNAIVGMKSEGTAGSKEYLEALLENLGVTGNDYDGVKKVEKLLGKRPSYYAQMEMLTKKIYQDPDFYTNLYDTPVNVARKGVAIQAISLMQKFDLYKSYLRNEASLAVLLELTLMKIQDDIENDSKN